MEFEYMTEPKTPTPDEIIAEMKRYLDTSAGGWNHCECGDCLVKHMEEWLTGQI